MSGRRSTFDLCPLCEERLASQSDGICSQCRVKYRKRRERLAEKKIHTEKGYARSTKPSTAPDAE